MASKIRDVVCDVTTTATVLAYTVVKKGAKAVATGMNPINLKRGIDLAMAKRDKTSQISSTPLGERRWRPVTTRGGQDCEAFSANIEQCQTGAGVLFPGLRRASRVEDD